MKPFHVSQTEISHGLTLLEAGAGTGKTYSLVRIIARHLVENKIPIDQILTVTFTRAATAEIKGRLHELLSEISLSLKEPNDKNDLVNHWRDTQSPEFLEEARINISKALANFDSVPIFTIDGFFQRLLKEFAFEANQLFSVELATDESQLIQTALRDYWRQHVYSLDRSGLDLFEQQVKFNEAQSFISEALRNPQATFDPSYKLSPTKALAPYLHAWKNFITELQEHKQGLFDFLTNVPNEFKKSGYPFYKNGVPMVTVINAIQIEPTEPAAPVLDLGHIEKLAFSHLQSDKVFKKGQFFNLSTHPLAKLFQSIDSLIEARPKNLKSAYYGDILSFVTDRLTQLKKERNVQSYSDVTNTLAALFEENSATSDAIKESIREKFQAGLIDEFQDTSPQQCTVFLNLFHHTDRYFHIIGDPKQSIYRFRGADVFSYIEAKNKADHEFSLLTNYRSTPRMIHAVNQIFTLSDDPFLVDQKIQFSRALWQGEEDATTPPDGPTALHLHTISPEIKKAAPIREACYKNIALEILNLLGTPWSDLGSDKKGSVTPADIAVLVRTGKEGLAISNTLSKLNIPVTLNSSSSLLDSDETNEIFTILTALLEPRKSGLLRMALLTPALGSGKMLTHNNQAEFDNLTYQVAELHKTWEKHGLMPMMLDFVKEFNIRTTLLALPQGQRRITNFMHLIELLDEKSRTLKLSPSATVQWLEMAIQGSVTDTDSEVLELRIATDDHAVQVRTQHTSKGLEFPITFVTSPCPADLSKQKPTLSYHNPATLKPRFAAIEDKDSEIFEQRKKETFADAARLAYVALTRSEVICHFYLIPATKKPEEHAVLQMLGMPTQEELQQLSDNSSGCIVYDEIQPDILEEPIPTWKGSRDETAQKTLLTTRDNSPITISHNQRTTSFSGITRNTPDIVHDSDSQTEAEITTTHTPEQESPKTPAPKFWKKLQAGASLGLVFHEILEEIDFQSPDTLESLISSKLLKYNPWKEKPSPQKLTTMTEEIAGSIQQLLTHPLSENDGITLDSIALNQRLTEPEFLLSGSQFSLNPLSKILANDPPANLPADYIQQLQSITTHQLDGYLTGFIDLIFEHDGRYHLLDWKTNQLNNYSRQSIAESMADHHYFLQYHLYSLALDRFLAQRLPHYDPEKHLGNTYYVYLRGVDPAIPGSGVFTDRLTPARLDALRASFR